MEQDTTTLKFWHGAQRWTGSPELRPSRPKCYECGPGIYLSNRNATARKYAKGGGQVVLIELDPSVVLLEESHLSLEEMLEGLASLPRVRRRKDIEVGLRKSARRHPDNRLPADYLMNYCVNYESLGGASGPALAQWYASKGIDASVYSRARDEDWVVVFNPEKIVSSRVLSVNDAFEVGDFEGMKDQKKRLTPGQRPMLQSVPSGL